MSSLGPGAVDPPRTRDEFLATPVAELAGLWLVVTCGGCGQVTCCALGGPAFVRHRGRPVSDVFGRLRCSHCRGPAVAVRLANTLTGPLHGTSVAAWEIRLLP